MSVPELVIFDCDGVLVDGEMAHCDVMSENFARYGLGITPQECMQTFAGGKMATIGERAARMGAQLPPGWIDEIYAEIFARLEQGVPVVAGVLDVLDRLQRAGIAFCVASNGSEDKMAITLGLHGILPRFEGAVFSAHSVGIWKPDPRLFQHAARTMGVTPAQCVVIEDSITGAAAARQAGMACFGYAADNDGARLAGEGAVLFHEMATLPGLLGLSDI